MANLNVNKVIYGGDVLIDLTGDSVSADKVLKGITAHDKSGAKITGTCTFDSDTSEDTAAVAEILVGKTAHARGSKLTGTMKNNGAVKGIISTVAGEYTVPQGYHDGSGKVSIDATEQAKLLASYGSNTFFHAAFYVPCSNIHDSHIVNSRAVLPSRCSSSGAVVALQSLEIFRCPFVVQFLDCDRRFQVIRILIKFHKSCVCIIVCWKV